jgi:nuclear cap-binding protein subunit 2
MSEYLNDLTPRSDYVDRKLCLRSFMTEAEFVKQRQAELSCSRTVYVGNLSFYTTEMQIEAHFSACGCIERIVMGLGIATKTPCGFCFVVFETSEDALAAVQDLNKTLLDDSIISVSWDVGLPDDARRWGRGVNGQVIDAKRPNMDDRRGGLGGMRQEANGIAPTLIESELIHYYWVAPPRLTNLKKHNSQGNPKGAQGGDDEKNRRGNNFGKRPRN